MNFSQFQRLRVFCLSFLLLSSTCGYAQSEKFAIELDKLVAKLDISTDQDAVGKLDKHPNAKDVHYFKMGNLANVQKNGLFDFPSPVTGKTIHAMTTRIEYASNKDYTWFGTVSDNNSFQGNMTLISQAGKVFGSLGFADESYQIVGIGNGISAFLPNTKTKTVKLCPNPSHDEVTVRTSSAVSSPNVVNGACQNTNRILVLYTQNAYNSVANISQTAYAAVAQFNQALYNTGIYKPEALLTVAGVQLLSNFNETTTNDSYFNIENDVSAIKTSSVVNDLRIAVKADIVVLLTNSNGYYGGYYGDSYAIPATKTTAFAVVEATHADHDQEWVLAHEVGHLFGGRHEDDPSTDYATGICFQQMRFLHLNTLL